MTSTREQILATIHLIARFVKPELIRPNVSYVLSILQASLTKKRVWLETNYICFKGERDLVDKTN